METAPALGRVFLSYARPDQKFAEQLKNDLEKNKVPNVWMDIKIQNGEVWSQAIDDALENSDTVVLVVSPHSRKSEFVTAEILAAQTKRIIPVIHEACSAWPLIMRFQHVDFRGWYEGGLKKLLAQEPPKKEWWRDIAITLARSGGWRAFLTVFAIVAIAIAYWIFLSPSVTHLSVTGADATSLVLVAENDGGRPSTLLGGTFAIDFGDLPLSPQKLEFAGDSRAVRVRGHRDLEIRLTVAEIPTPKTKADRSDYSKDEIARLIAESTITITGRIEESNRSIQLWTQRIPAAEVEPFIAGVTPKPRRGPFDEDS